MTAGQRGKRVHTGNAHDHGHDAEEPTTGTERLQ